MNNKTIIILAIIVALGVALTVYTTGVSKKKSKQAEADLIKAGGDATAEQTKAQIECSKNWFCSASNLLGGLSGFVGVRR